MDRSEALCGCTQKLPTSMAHPPDLPMTGTPISSLTNANALADSLGVSPMYRQVDSARWQVAAQLYQSSRAQSPTPGGVKLHVPSSYGSVTGTPLASEDIAFMNRKRFHESMGAAENEGHLELEAIAAVHELSNNVLSIYVSEMLPRTADLIFVNVKTVEDHAFTLELTMKGWRVASTHTDSMNGDYMNVALHTKYFNNVREVMNEISPGHSKKFEECLCRRLELLQKKKIRKTNSIKYGK
ncbi:unnamed protein product [Bursaphelenchus xylophilus]|uniref:(pine wood nematode) hypothetical protein n=1 Tax=Bursaphelenchus xylophilus TaxID=6326 RepID=A0A1I7RH49_BURXY|nr:unnamed protein product [Bursaphelenchus xylophilus]CAG9115977.1 unnamed protein product [Bursaphelenchus xylophilus]